MTDPISGSGVLTPNQLQFFHTNGYLKLPGIIPGGLITRLRELFDGLTADHSDPADKVIHYHNEKSYITNLENICPKGNLSCIELLGSPFIQHAGKIICGDDFFPIQDFAVIKNQGDELPVLWHRDMMHRRTGHCFTMGIYLDDVYENDGALRIIPGSHNDERNICEVIKEPFTEIPVKAGDVLIHDMLLAHSSEPLRKNKIRRVIYFEFLSAAHVFNENIYTEALVKRRTGLLEAAVIYYRQLNELKNADHDTMTTAALQQILAEIYKERVHARPSDYCLDGIF